MENETKILAEIDKQKRPPSFFQVEEVTAGNPQPTEHQKQFILDHYPAYADPEEMVTVLDWLFERAEKKILAEIVKQKRSPCFFQVEEDTSGNPQPTETQKRFILDRYPAYADPEEMVAVLDWLFERTTMKAEEEKERAIMKAEEEKKRAIMKAEEEKKIKIEA